MLIAADENIPYVADAFGRFGTIRLLPGRNISAENIRDADALLVRSVTRVGRGLLAGSRVRFVGSATIGTDHVDTGFLSASGIAFHSAPGSNAASVADYITSSLIALERRLGIQLGDLSAAVIGVGNVGSRVVSRFKALGIQPLLNDPPLKDATGDERFRPLNEVLPAADIVTLHVPLTKEGRHPTYHLADERFLRMLKPGAVFINTSRGQIVDETALRSIRQSGHISAVVLDVFHNEPDVCIETLEACDVATPHIAGYALDGKARGTQMLHDAFAEFVGEEPYWQMDKALPEPALPAIELPAGRETLREAVLAVYDVMEDDARLRRIRLLPPALRGGYFDRLRKDYPERREFRNTTVRLHGHAEDSLIQSLSGLTFRVEVTG